MKIGSLSLSWLVRATTKRNQVISLRRFMQDKKMSVGATKMQHHEMLTHVSWLFGKWKSEAGNGKGKYPTISDFNYSEEVEFTPIGMKPVIEYKFYSHHPTNATPMHREVGYIRLQPNSRKIAFVIAHNVGVVEIQEGEVNDQTLTVETTELGRTSFNKPPAVTKLRRTLTRTGSQLEHVLEMETENTKLTEHLRVTYDKVE